MTGRLTLTLTLALLLTGCGEHVNWRRTLREIGPEKFRAETIRVCRESFARGGSHEIPKPNWPEAVRASRCDK